MVTFFNKVLGKDKWTSPSMPCPHCGALRAKFVESLNLGVTRWRCGACSGTWRYMKATPPPDLLDAKKDPALLYGGRGVVDRQIKLDGIPFRGRVKLVTPKD